MPPVFLLLAFSTACTSYTPGGPGSRLALVQALAVGLGIAAVALAAVAFLVHRSRTQRPRAATRSREPSSSVPIPAGVDPVLQRIVRLAKAATQASAVLYFDLDQASRRVLLRHADTAAPVIDRASLPADADPFAFVVERRQSFYITDYRTLLWELPYYGKETRVGTLLAVPVLTGETLRGILVAEKIETQAFTGDEPGLLEGFADLLGAVAQPQGGPTSPRPA